MKKYHLVDGYVFKGYMPLRRFERLQSSHDNRIIVLKRIQKKRNAFVAVNHTKVIMTRKPNVSVICPVGIWKSIFNLTIDGANAKEPDK